MKRNFIFLFLFAHMLAYSQPRMFVCGPAYTIGTGNFENIAFSRTSSISADGTPTMTFGDLQSAKFSSSTLGLLTEMNFHHFHMALDLAFPFKGKFKNISGTANSASWFNLALAWGGYIKEKYGILGGFSLNTNTSSYTPQPTSFTDNANASSYSAASTTSGLDYTKDGRYYMNSFYKGTVGLDLHFVYAITEQFVARVSYSFLVTGIKLDGASPPAGSTLESHVNGCRRTELGLFYQLNDNFGFFAKYTYTGIALKSSVNTDVVDPTTSNKVNQNVSIFPNQSQKLSVFTLGVMIPLGSAESRSGNITVTPN